MCFLWHKYITGNFRLDIQLVQIVFDLHTVWQMCLEYFRSYVTQHKRKTLLNWVMVFPWCMVDYNIDIEIRCLYYNQIEIFNIYKDWNVQQSVIFFQYLKDQSI